MAVLLLKRTKKTRGAKSVRRGRKARIARSVIGKNPPRKDQCVLHETIDLGTLYPNQAYNYQISLSQCSLRARTTAQYFQWYRIVKVEYIYKPLSNTFQEGTGGAVPSVPQMYKIMNRNGYMSLSSLQQIIAMGAKAKEFVHDTKLAYRPNNLVQMVYNNYTDSTPVNNKNSYGMSTYKWLSCQDYGSGGIVIANSVPYYGHSVYIQQQNVPTSAQFVATLEARITIEYKEPGILSTFPS
nr:MAG: capsid protein [Cressdnaviricota sp.]